MPKRIAVLVRERQEEALRVAAGLTLGPGRVEVYVLDRRLADSRQVAAFVAALGEMGVPLATNAPANTGLELLANEQIARRLAACDHVIPY